MTNSLDKWYSKFVDERTRYYRDKLGFAPDETSTHNNRSDAFKHCFTSSTLVLLVTWIGSLLFTNKHEWKNLDSGAPVEESIMDFNNNKVGRTLGLKALKAIFTFRYSEEKLAKEIVKRLDSLELITSLQDPRIQWYKNGTLDVRELFDRDCDCEKFKTYLRKNVKCD